MRMLKKSNIIFLSVLLIIQTVFMSACTTEVGNGNITNNNNKGDTTMGNLNDRQISICEDIGLPTSYDELSSNQQQKINRIEELLQYLDTKYNDTFNYVGYYNSILEDEKLEAYSSQFNEYEYTTLTIQDDGTFTDDYPFVFVKRLLRDDIVFSLNKTTGYSYKAYVITGDTTLNDVSSINISSLSGNSWASLTVFVSGEKSVEEGKKIGEAIKEWYTQKGIYGTTNVIAINSEAFETINFANYQSVKREQGVNNLISCDVDSSGNAKIY